MKKSMFLMCLVALMVSSLSIKAQEVTVTLLPGWNWMSIPNTDTIELTTAFGSFTPETGDIIKSQYSFSTYMNGQWIGDITQFYPGCGYKYKSERTEPVTFTIGVPSSQVVVTVAEPTNITTDSAMVDCNVTIYEGNHVFARGVCWSTEQMPNVDGDHISGDAVAGVQSFTLHGLEPNTTYYVRAYVVTDYGLVYSSAMVFTTESDGNGGNAAPIGAIDGLFTINSSGGHVYFAQGNLQYQASTNTWRFAGKQYNIIGSSNRYISSTYSGWIDLFGWGTSGYHDTIDQYNVNYQPWSSSTSTVNKSYNYYGYGPSTNMISPNLTGSSANYDWGVYNPISNGGDTANLWRTPTISEWNYVLNKRSTPSGIRYAKAKVSNVNGVILLPDDWSSSIYDLSNTNTKNASYNSNVISSSQWTTLENAGAVFLPAAGIRGGTSAVNAVGEDGFYWSTTYGTSYNSDALYFYNGSLYLRDYFRYYGVSVRLIYPC